MSRLDPDPDEVRDPRPYDYEGAKRAVARASRDQTDAESFLKESAKDFAQKEEAYRVELAKEIVRQHESGVAWTVAPDLARGNTFVARLRRDRDVAEGVKEAAAQMAWKASANRKSLDRLIDWSMRVAPLGQEQEPAELARPVGAVG